MKPITIIILAVCICFNLSCTENKQVQTEKTKRILFSKSDSRNKNKNIEFSNHFTLNADKFLSIHFSLEQPLVQSLQLLAPNLSTEELLNKGNFQFSIMVDGKTIYVENLDKGAGLVASKTTQLEHRLPLITPERIDFWAWFMWLKFMKMGGGQDVLSEGNHVLSIELRPYLNDEKLHVGPLLAQGDLNITVGEIPVDEKTIALQSIMLNSGWELSSDNFDQRKIEALNKKIAQNRFEKINGIVVIKNGKLLIEEYFNGEERESLHDPRSVGKSIASTMMGIAIDEGYIENEYMPLKDFYNLKSFSNYSPKKDAITLKSLLTMSSGFLGDDSDYNSPGNEELMYPTNNWVKFALDLPIQKNKVMGKDYSYFTAGAVLLGDIIHKSVPEGLVSFTDKKLFAPLKITNYQWQYTPQNVGNTAGGIQLRAIDFAKYGQLYKNKGLWNGTQILSEAWVNKSLSPHVKQPYNNNAYYGYLFWNKIYTVDGNNYELSFCTGNGGNKIFIFKDIPFVVVITSSAYNLPYAHSDVDKMMIDYILPAIIN